MTRVFSDEDHTFDRLLEYLINGFLEDVYSVLEAIAGLDKRVNIFHGLHKTHELCVSIQLPLDGLEKFVR